MTKYLYRTRENTYPKNKPRVYFTCHPDDFSLYFEKVCKDIFKTHDCAIYYTEDMMVELEEENKATDLGQMNLFVIPVTFKLLTTSNRAMDSDFIYAQKEHIPVLPLMMESGIEEIYSRLDKFGELQYINPYSRDLTEISYEEKLKKYLESVLISNEMVKRVQDAFDAYIFLSYRKKDRRYANELMRIIHAKSECRNIAIWYDEYLTPGESFNENISRMLKESKLFTLLVTPSLLEEPNGNPNFVMAHEYPTARDAGMDILPTEMEETNKETLSKKYVGIPACVNPCDEEAFRERLLNAIKKIVVSAKDDDPEHNFLIGLAYFDGIDVEVNRERGIRLITLAAEADLIEAAKKLVEIYQYGLGTEIEHFKVIYWQVRVVDLYAKQILKQKGKDIDFDEIMNYMNSILFLGGKYYDVSKFEEAVQNYHAILDFSKKFSLYLKLNSDILSAAAYNNLGIIHNLKNCYTEAIRFHRKAIGLREKIMRKEPKHIANDLMDSYINIAIVYEKMQQYKDVLKILKRAFHLYDKWNGSVEISKVKLAKVHKTLGIMYASMNDYKQSNKEYRLVYELLNPIMEYSDDTVFLEYADTLYNMGINYVQIKKSDEAIKFFQGAEVYYGKLYKKDAYTHTLSLINVYYEIALLYYEKKSYQQALSLIELSERLCMQAEKVGQNIALYVAKVYSCKGKILFEMESTKQSMEKRELLVDEQYSLSLDAFHKAEEYIVKVELNYQTAISYIYLYNDLGRAYYRMYKNKQSQESYHKAYNLHVRYYEFDKSKRKILGILYYNFALLSYHNYHDKVSAREMMDKALKVFRNLPDENALYLQALEFKRKYLNYFY